MRSVGSVVPALVPLVVATAAAELAVRQGWVRAYLIPAPSSVLRAMVQDSSELLGAIATTSFSAVSGFLLSVVVGIAVAVFLSSSRAIQRAFYPYAVFFQTVPIIAIAPLLVIWFGYGTRTVVASAFVVSIFPVIANTLTGILSTEPALRDLFRLYGASTGATLFKL